MDAILEAASKNSKVEIPEEMIKDETNRMIGEFSEQLKMQGIEFSQYLQMVNITEDKIREDMKPEAEKRVNYRLLLDEIAKAENIEINDEEAKAEAKVLAEKYGMKEDELLKAFGGLEMIKYDLRYRKTIELLKENN